MPDFVYSGSYRGEVKAVILNWSGTTADAYVVAPAVVFVEVFRRQGVEIAMSEARGPMGLRKDLHIKALTEVPEIRERWKAVHGSYPGQDDVDRMFAEFVPLQLECLRQYAGLLPGVAEVTQRLQGRGIRIGSTTGFTRPMVEILEAEAAKQGYRPNASVAGDDVIHGARPGPFMLYRRLAAEEIERRVAKTRGILTKAGAHYVIDSIANIEPVIEDINARLARGTDPSGIRAAILARHLISRRTLRQFRADAFAGWREIVAA